MNSYVTQLFDSWTTKDDRDVEFQHKIFLRQLKLTDINYTQKKYTELKNLHENYYYWKSLLYIPEYYNRH